MNTKIINIFDYLLAVILTGGFVSIFSTMFDSTSLWNVFILITLPLVIGSVLTKEKYGQESILFLGSSIYMIFGFILMFSTNHSIIIWLGIITMNIGAFFLSLGIIRLMDKVNKDIVGSLK